MSTRMLIDASHPEETRVAVMKGNKVEEFDFESQARKQLRGNIYLAKITRVEPSLQAAFVDYGGNRHGFLAFSEIHPDYYQIPVADRQALLREEADAARSADEDEETAAKTRSRSRARSKSDEDETDDAQAKPKRRRRRRSAKSDEDANEASNDDAPDTDGADEDDGSDDDTPTTMAAANDSESISEPAGADGEEPPRPKRRRTSRRKAEPVAEEAPAVAAVETAAEVEGENEAPKPKRRRASRAKPKDEPAAETPDAAEAKSDDASQEEEDAPKPKRRRRKAAPKAEAESETGDAEQPSEVVASANDEGEADEKPKRRRRSARAKSTDAADAETPAEAKGQADEGSDDEGEAKPRRRRRSRAKPAAKTDASPDGDDEDDSDESVEQVGTDDAMEEVPERRISRRSYKIQEVVKRRQIMLVQIVKEERGNKGAALTTYLSLAGRYSVLMPNTARGGGISRKITNAADRKKLKEIAGSLEVSEGMGVILRTAGASRTKGEIKRDFEYLLRLWENVRQLTLKSTAPCLVYEEGSLIKRSIRDLYDEDTKEIVVAGREGYEEARDFMSMLMPEEAARVQFHDGKVPLFVKQGVESQLDQMLEQQVTLRSGGYLVINQTEALVAIDVNSGKATRQHSIEETAVQTNLEAAEEVARQLRLRDLAGLIVIDFIDMDDRRNNRAVEKRLKDSLKNDRARIQVGRISHFGLMEMSRQRIRASVLDTATVTCPHCAGLGFVRSPSSVAIQVLRTVEEHLTRSANHNLILKVRAQTALFLLNNQRSSLDDLEDRFGVTLRVEIDEGVSDQVDIEKADQAVRRRREPTHVQVDSVDLPDAEPDDADEPEAVQDAYSTDAEAKDAPEAANDDDESKPRKRRRGRRGGRRKSEGDDNASTEAGEGGDAVAAVASTEPVEPEAEVEAKTEADVPKPKRRRRSTRKSDADADAETAGGTPAAVADDASPEEAPTKPKRRSTRKPKADAEPVDADAKPDPAVLDTAIHAVSDEVVHGSAGEPIADATDASEADGEPARPQRRQTGRPKRKSAAGPEASDDGEPGEKSEKKGWLQRTFFG